MFMNPAALRCLSLLICILVRATGQSAEQTPSGFALQPHLTRKATFDGKLLLTAQGGVAYLWDVETGKELQRFQGHTGDITALASSPDGKELLTAGASRVGLFIKGESVRLWDVKTGREIRRFNEQPSELAWVFDVQFSPDGRRILTMTQSTSNLVEIWDAQTGRRLFAFPDLYLCTFGFPAAFSVNFSSDGRRIVELIDKGRRSIVWDSHTGKVISTITNAAYSCSVQMNPDGNLVLTSSSTGTARTWDANTGQLVQIFAGHTNRVSQASFTPDGQHIVTASHDGSARLWETKTGREIKRFQIPGPGAVDQLHISRDGKRLITIWSLEPNAQTTNRRGASLWDLGSGREITQLTNSYEEIVGFSPVDERFMVIKQGKPAALWDGATGEIIRQYDNLGAAKSEER